MLFQGTLLTLVGLEFIAKYAQGHARLAAIAIRPVGEETASSKTALYQVRLHIGLNQMTGSCHLRARLTAIKVTARVGRSGIKLQRAEWQVLEVCHEAPVRQTSQSMWAFFQSGLVSCKAGTL